MIKPLLEVQNLTVKYGAITALHNVDIRVEEGEVVSLIGANGAGKTTLLRTISGLLTPKTGSVSFFGSSIVGVSAHKIVRGGISHIPEGRMVFANLTVDENLQMGGYLLSDKRVFAAERDFVFSIFPRLRERMTQSAGTLSGGEQQMLAIGRALMSKPRFLMLDEPSLGIAPILVRSIFEKIVEINKMHGLTILLVEQNANMALEISSRGYVLETGRVILTAPSSSLRNDPKVRSAYLGG